MITKLEYPDWGEKDLKDLQHGSFYDVSDVNLRVAQNKKEKPFFIFSSPVTTAGYGKESNLKIIKEADFYVRKIMKLPLFNNILPLEIAFQRLINEWYDQGNTGYCTPILEIVYKEMFESGLVKGVIVIPNYSDQKSVGSEWEKRKSKELGIPVYGFPIGYYLEIIKKLDLPIPNSSSNHKTVEVAL